METRVLSGSGPAAAEAIEIVCGELERGGVVALPTETVYGLAGDALNATAAARIFEAKERPFFDPLICHLPDLEWLERMCAPADEVRPLVGLLAARFWPGPLTLVLQRRANVPDLVCAGMPTVAVRWSAHPLFQKVLSRFGRPLAAPSANRFGRISPTAAVHVVAELAGRIPFILDGGPCAHGLESTIVAPEAGGVRILRAGPITREQLEEIAPVLGAQAGVSDPGRTRGLIEAPGQLDSHYAPATKLRLLDGAAGGGPLEGRCGLLAWQRARPGFECVEVLTQNGSPSEAAARLFAALRSLDEAGLDCLYAELAPEIGLGVAINDRLRRAAFR